MRFDAVAGAFGLHRAMLVNSRADLDNHLRGILKAFGRKVGKAKPNQFEERVLAARAAEVELPVAITLTCRRTRSAASAGNRSY